MQTLGAIVILLTAVSLFWPDNKLTVRWIGWWRGMIVLAVISLCGWLVVESVRHLWGMVG